MSGAEAIPLREIEDWARHFWPLDITRLVHRVMVLDLAHRQWCAKRTADKAEAVPNVAHRPAG